MTKTNINFRNINRIFPKGIIKKMRQEDLIGFYVDKRQFMSQREKELFSRKILGSGTTNFPAGSELLVERKGGKLSFIDFLEEE